MLSSNILTIIRSEFSKLRIPQTHDKVYNDECVLSFDSPYSDEGLFINLQTFYGYGVDYYLENSIRTGCKLYLHEVWRKIPIQPTEEEQNPQVLGIGIEGGFQTSPKFEIVKNNSLVVVTENGPVEISLTEEGLPEFIRTVCNGILEHQGMKENMQVDTWQADLDIIESKHASNLPQLNNGKKISNDPQTWRCELSGETNNLWLNLSTGYIGGGRKHWDGTGGSGAALKHYEETGRFYPLCVKLGTITPHGADVWSYDPDEDCLVTVPRLGEYLSHWGIDIMKLEKTEMTLGETEIAKNKGHNWNQILEKGENLELISCPGCIGLTNIGSSCYMNVILQTLFAIDEFQERYYHHARDILNTSFPTQDPTQDPFIQISKVACGLLSPRYVLPESYLVQEKDTKSGTPPTQLFNDKYILAPRMFKALVSKDSRDFSSGRQQDASEYFQYLLKQIQKYERVGLKTRLNLAQNEAEDLSDTTSIFEYQMEERYQCLITNQVKYISGKQTLTNILELPIPLEEATNQHEIQQAKEKKRKLSEEMKENNQDVTEITATGSNMEEEEEEIKLIVPFQSCLNSFFHPSQVDLRNPSITSEGGPLTPAMKTHRFQSFPKYLMVKLGRYYVDSSWVMRKIDAEVAVPEFLDLSSWRGVGGLQSDEIPMPDTSNIQNETVASSTTTATTMVANEDIVNQLTGMGFSLHGSKRAAIATQNLSIEAAMGWVFEHMDDANFNEPLPEGNSSNVLINDDNVMALTALGYSEMQCRAALKATDNNPERAADWLFSHMDDLDLAVQQQQQQQQQITSIQDPSQHNSNSNNSGRYHLIGIISHLGRNTDHGHYVCHLKKDNKWIFFNDDQVALSKSPPLSHGFMYLFKSE